LTLKEVKYLAEVLSLLENISRNTEIIRIGSFDPLRVWFVQKTFSKRGRGKINPNLDSVDMKNSFNLIPLNTLPKFCHKLGKALNFCVCHKSR